MDISPFHHVQMVSEEATDAIGAVLLEMYGYVPNPAIEWKKKIISELVPYLMFAPTGDNHHNAMACPYCSPRE